MSKQWKKAAAPNPRSTGPWEQVIRPIEFAFQMMALDDCSGKHGPAASALTAKRGPANAG
jgi:hypothetical protein